MRDDRTDAAGGRNANGGTATNPPADRIAAIEGAQPAAASDLGKLTIDELMKRFNVPGVSIAVIHETFTLDDDINTCRRAAYRRVDK